MPNQTSALEISERAFHITIGTYPSSELSLEQELRLLKAALLYADRVKLYSLQASAVSMASKIGDISPRHQLRLIEMVAPYLTSQEQFNELSLGLQAYKKIIRRKHPGRQELILRNRFERLLKEQWENVREVGQRIAREAGAESITRAVELGVLELHTFEGTDSEEEVTRFIADCLVRASQSSLLLTHTGEMSKRDEQMIREFVEGVCGAVSDGSTYPLFDEQTGLLVKEQIQEQRITPSESAVGRGKHTGLAGHLLARLPSFDQASVDEVVDIRRELDKPLTRFRGAVIKFSEQIRSAPWDEDFSSDAETVFHRDVKPAILEIEEAVKSNRYLASLLRKLVDKPLVLPAGSAIALVLSNISSLPGEIAVSIGAGVSALSVVYDAFEEWKQKKQTIERNTMYFYYRAGKQISE
jgi:hypothetical protein